MQIKFYISLSWYCMFDNTCKNCLIVTIYAFISAFSRNFPFQKVLRNIFSSTLKILGDTFKTQIAESVTFWLVMLKTHYLPFKEMRKRFIHEPVILMLISNNIKKSKLFSTNLGRWCRVSYRHFWQIHVCLET